MSAAHNDLLRTLANADIYVIDQVMRERFTPAMHVLDCGCGGGRNGLFLMRMGLTVSFCDRNPDAIKALRSRIESEDFAGSLGRIESCEIDEMPFEHASFDAVISNAVLHFARDELHFAKLLESMWEVLKPGGIFFARVSTTDGVLDHLTPLGADRYRLPTGQEWFLVDVKRLKEMSDALCGELIDPVKSSLVDEQRTMTTWVMRKQ